MNILLLVIGVAAGTVICLSARFYSAYIEKSHKKDQEHGVISHHWVMSNVAYIFFAIFIALIIGFFSWLFR